MRRPAYRFATHRSSRRLCQPRGIIDSRIAPQA